MTICMLKLKNHMDTTMAANLPSGMWPFLYYKFPISFASILRLLPYLIMRQKQVGWSVSQLVSLKYKAMKNRK